MDVTYNIATPTMGRCVRKDLQGQPFRHTCANFEMLENPKIGATLEQVHTRMQTCLVSA